MARRELILKDENDNFVGFSGNPVTEYPYAKHFHRLSDARIAAKKYLVNHPKTNEVGVIEFYGFENETVVDAVYRSY